MSDVHKVWVAPACVAALVTYAAVSWLPQIVFVAIGALMVFLLVWMLGVFLMSTADAPPHPPPEMHWPSTDDPHADREALKEVNEWLDRGQRKNDTLQ